REGVVSLASHMTPDEALQCANKFNLMLVTWRRERNDDLGAALWAEALAHFGAWLEPNDANGLCSAAAEILLEVLENTEWLGGGVDPYAMPELSIGLAKLAAHIEPKQSARMCERATVILMHSLENGDFHRAERMINAVAALAARMEPTAAARVSA